MCSYLGRIHTLGVWTIWPLYHEKSLEADCQMGVCVPVRANVCASVFQCVCDALPACGYMREWCSVMCAHCSSMCVTHWRALAYDRDSAPHVRLATPTAERFPPVWRNVRANASTQYIIGAVRNWNSANSSIGSRWESLSVCVCVCINILQIWEYFCIRLLLKSIRNKYWTPCIVYLNSNKSYSGHGSLRIARQRSQTSKRFDYANYGSERVALCFRRDGTFVRACVSVLLSVATLILFRRMRICLYIFVHCSIDPSNRWHVIIFFVVVLLPAYTRSAQVNACG